MEVYEVMGKPKRGWEEMLERIEPSPIKVLATLVLHEDEKVQELEVEDAQLEEVAPIVSAPTDKISVRTYNNNKDKKQERWWEKKIF